MCGIAGFINTQGRGEALAMERQATAMADALAHRGPDSSGVWTNPDAGIGFGFRRLSIIDLTANGEQPMQSEDGRFIIAYNGEIYNFAAIRSVLKSQGVRFKGKSDTEVILKACMQWGVERAVADFVGMFAFAFWDNTRRKLWIVRDRVGIKPVYYGFAGERFAFASELKALRALDDWTPSINRSALNDFIQFNYVPAPLSIYENIKKLEPGCILEFESGSSPKISRYWDPRDAHAQPITDIGENEAIDECEKLLSDAVEQRLVSDVPLGALLSGGIDSSTVVALMNRANKGAVRTFTIGFGDTAYDETSHAKDIARHIGTDHTALELMPDTALDLIPKMSEIYDEPFADSSALPTYLVSQLARRHVTVALSGDGGDEVFLGYNRYKAAPSIWRKSQLLPHLFRSISGCALKSIRPQTWDFLAALLPSNQRPRTAGIKIHKIASLLAQESEEEVYRHLVSHWHGERLVVGADQKPNTEWPDNHPEDFASRMALQDTLTYLPDDILTKVDRASMAVGLEVRVPMLDHRLVEFMARLPVSLKLKNGTPKHILRQILYRYVPQELVNRPKMGFAVPLDRWLRGPLRDWAEDLLSEKRLRDEGWFNPAPIRKAWDNHLKGNGIHQEGLWGVLMAQSWLDRWT
jgi:asparagine synthase (glutamine-hydrolysing)